MTEFINDVFIPSLGVGALYGLVGISFNLIYARCSPHRGGIRLPKTKPLFRRLRPLYLKRGVELTLMMHSRYRIETYHGMALVHVGEYQYGQYGGSHRSLGFKRMR